MPFLGVVGCVLADVDLEVRPLVGGAQASCVDDVDAASAQFFVNSSLALVLLLRRRVKSVADVLKGIRQHGFSPRRWETLHRYWGAFCRQGPCGSVRSLEPWGDWIPPDGGFLTLLRAAGTCTNIWWKLQKQLPGSTPSWSAMGRSLHICVGGKVGVHEVRERTTVLLEP